MTQLDQPALEAAAQTLDPLSFTANRAVPPRGLEGTPKDGVAAMMKTRRKSAIHRAKKAISAYLQAVGDGWQPIEEYKSSVHGREVWCFSEDGGVFVGFFGACDIFPMTDSEIEEIGEVSYWSEDWWTFCHDGPVRLEGELAPTKFRPLPSPPQGEKG